MKLLKYFITDIKRAFYTNRYRYIIVFVMITIIMLIPVNISNSINKHTSEWGSLSFFDNIFYMIGGVEFIETDNIKEIKIPFAWMAIQFLCGLVTLDYVESDLKGIGKTILLNTKSKTIWWTSKCLCIILMTMAVYGILYVIAIAVSGINHTVTGGLHFDLLKVVCSLKNDYVYLDKMNVYLLTVPLIVSVCTSLIQTALAQIISPVISLAVILSADVIAVFSNNRALIGNMGMLLRSNMCADNGINLVYAILASVITATLAVAAGGMYFCRRDIV